MGNAAVGLLNLGGPTAHIDRRAVTSVVSANHVPQPTHQQSPILPPVNTAALRQMSGVQAGVDDYLRRYGLQRNDPTPSEDGMSLAGDVQAPPLTRPTVKSGKCVSVTSRVVLAEMWPHSFLGRQFIGINKQYEDLSISEFCAGYSGILREVQSASVLRYRLLHLEDLMYFASIYSWSSVLKFHAAVLVEIEKGVLKWGDDFRHLQSTTLITRVESRRDNGKGSGQTKNSGGKNSVLYCAAYQNGMCSFPNDHEGVLNGQTRVLRHVCAKCLHANPRSIVQHPDKSPQCPLNAGRNMPPTITPAAPVIPVSK